MKTDDNSLHLEAEMEAFERVFCEESHDRIYDK